MFSKENTVLLREIHLPNGEKVPELQDGSCRIQGRDNVRRYLENPPSGKKLQLEIRDISGICQTWQQSSNQPRLVVDDGRSQDTDPHRDLQEPLYTLPHEQFFTYHAQQAIKDPKLQEAKLSIMFPKAMASLEVIRFLHRIFTETDKPELVTEFVRDKAIDKSLDACLQKLHLPNGISNTISYFVGEKIKEKLSFDQISSMVEAIGKEVGDQWLREAELSQALRESLLKTVQKFWESKAAENKSQNVKEYDLTANTPSGECRVGIGLNLPMGISDFDPKIDTEKRPSAKDSDTKMNPKKKQRIITSTIEQVKDHTANQASKRTPLAPPPALGGVFSMGKLTITPFVVPLRERPAIKFKNAAYYLNEIRKKENARDRFLKGKGLRGAAKKHLEYRFRGGRKKRKIQQYDKELKALREQYQLHLKYERIEKTLLEQGHTLQIMEISRVRAYYTNVLANKTKASEVEQEKAAAILDAINHEDIGSLDRLYRYHDDSCLLAAYKRRQDTLSNKETEVADLKSNPHPNKRQRIDEENKQHKSLNEQFQQISSQLDGIGKKLQELESQNTSAMDVEEENIPESDSRTQQSTQEHTTKDSGTASTQEIDDEEERHQLRHKLPRRCKIYQEGFYAEGLKRMRAQKSSYNPFRDAWRSVTSNIEIAKEFHIRHDLRTGKSIIGDLIATRLSGLGGDTSFLGTFSLSLYRPLTSDVSYFSRQNLQFTTKVYAAEKLISIAQDPKQIQELAATLYYGSLKIHTGLKRGYQAIHQLCTDRDWYEDKKVAIHKRIIKDVHDLLGLYDSYSALNNLEHVIQASECNKKELLLTRFKAYKKAKIALTETYEEEDRLQLLDDKSKICELVETHHDDDSNPYFTPCILYKINRLDRCVRELSDALKIVVDLQAGDLRRNHPTGIGHKKTLDKKYLEQLYNYYLSSPNIYADSLIRNDFLGKYKLKLLYEAVEHKKYLYKKEKSSLRYEDPTTAFDTSESAWSGFCGMLGKCVENTGNFLEKHFPWSYYKEKKSEYKTAMDYLIKRWGTFELELVKKSLGLQICFSDSEDYTIKYKQILFMYYQKLSLNEQLTDNDKKSFAIALSILQTITRIPMYDEEETWLKARVPQGLFFSELGTNSVDTLACNFIALLKTDQEIAWLYRVVENYEKALTDVNENLKQAKENAEKLNNLLTELEKAVNDVKASAADKDIYQQLLAKYQELKYELEYITKITEKEHTDFGGAKESGHKFIFICNRYEVKVLSDTLSVENVFLHEINTHFMKFKTLETELIKIFNAHAKTGEKRKEPEDMEVDDDQQPQSANNIDTNTPPTTTHATHATFFHHTIPSCSVDNPTYDDDWLLQLGLWLSLVDSGNRSEKRNLFGLKPCSILDHKSGNCLFEAVATCDYQHPRRNSVEIRKLAITHIQQDPQLESHITDLAGHENTSIRTRHGDRTYKSFAEYVHFMSQDQTWGTLVELVALARALRRPIVILTPENDYDQIIEEDSYIRNNPIFLSYIGDNHYIPLAVPRGRNPREILEQIRIAITERNQKRERKDANSIHT